MPLRSKAKGIYSSRHELGTDHNSPGRSAFPMSQHDSPAADHHLTYRICSHDRTNPVRPVEVHATPEEIIRFAEQGYLVRERLFSTEQVERLRGALEEVVQQETGEGLPDVSSMRR